MVSSLWFLNLFPLLLESLASLQKWSQCGSSYSRTQVSQTKCILLKGQFLEKTIPSPSKQHTKLANLWVHSHIPKMVAFLEAQGMKNWLTINNPMRCNSPQPLTLPFKSLPRLKMPQYSQDTCSNHWNSSIYTTSGNCFMLYKVILFQRHRITLNFLKHRSVIHMISLQF